MVLLLQKHNCGIWQCWDRASSKKMQRRGSEKSHLSNLTMIWWDFKFGRQLIRCTVVTKVTSFWGSHAFSFLYSKFPLNIPQVLSSVQSLSHVWLCNPRDSSMSGLPVHYQLPGFTQTQVHWVSDAIQTSRPLASPSPPAFNLSQHQGLSKWVSSSHQMAKVLEFQLWHQPFQWIFRTDTP